LWLEAIRSGPAQRHILWESCWAPERDLELEPLLEKLDRIDAVSLDGIGYVQQNREEMDVLFTFLSERYESQPDDQVEPGLQRMGPYLQGSDDGLSSHRSADSPFDHPELDNPSYRAEAARARQNRDGGTLCQSCQHSRSRFTSVDPYSFSAVNDFPSGRLAETTPPMVRRLVAMIACWLTISIVPWASSSARSGTNS
jgi:hypothetical protein